MRLIHAKTYRVELFLDDETPKYAILSHRWEGEEVEFVHLLPDQLTGDPTVRCLNTASDIRGYSKIYEACARAQEEGIEWLWIDTCCINNSDSREHSEAINSMFRYYEAAEICYTFLSDVLNDDDFENSLWFTRGWTLQELLAPAREDFYDASWRKLGDKRSLARRIEKASGVAAEVFLGETKLSDHCIAQRMSWASKRVTKRQEDQAYCLLGIFGINLDLRYGEKKEAFKRLQEEIIRTYGNYDDSMFAWSSVDQSDGALLALSPAAFKSCHSIEIKGESAAMTVSSRGITSDFQLRPVGHYTYLAKLSCRDSAGENIGIYLRQLPGSSEYIRIRFEGKFRTDVGHHHDFQLERGVTVLRGDRVKHVGLNNACKDVPRYGFKIERLPATGRPKVDLEDENAIEWTGKTMLFRNQNMDNPTLGLIDLGDDVAFVRVLRLGFDARSNPICLVGTESAIDARTASHSFEETTLIYCFPFSVFLSFGLLLILYPAWREAVSASGYHNGRGIRGYTLPTARDNGFWDYDGTTPMNSATGQYVDYKADRTGLWFLRGHRATGLDVLLLDNVNRVGAYEP